MLLHIEPTTGRVVSGAGSGALALDNEAIGWGGTPGWVTPTQIAYNGLDDKTWRVLLYDTETKITTVATVDGVEVAGGANELCAGGGRWARWLGDSKTGLTDSTGLALEDAGLADVGPDGTLYYCQNRAIGKGILANTRTNRALQRSFEHEWLAAGNGAALTPAARKIAAQTLAMQTHPDLIIQPATVATAWVLHGAAQRCVWGSYGLKLFGWQVSVSQVPGESVFSPSVVMVGDRAWLVYGTQNRLLCHPATNPTLGYVVAMGAGLYYPHAIAWHGGIRIAYSTMPGARPGNQRVVDIDPSVAELSVLLPPIVPPPEPIPMTVRATIISFETPVLLSGTSRAVAKVTTPTKPERFWWSYQDGTHWVRVADNPASDLDHHFKFPRVGDFPIRLEAVINNRVVDVTHSARIVKVIQTPAPTPVPPNPVPPGPSGPVSRLHADGRIFRTADGAAWRWKGVSGFALLDRFAKGQDISDTLNAYRGFNLFRVWPYVPAKDWGAKAWDVQPASVTRAFLARMAQAGFYVELTLLTDDDPARLAWAQAFVPALTAGGSPENLLLEAGNEPTTHKNINTAALHGVLSTAGCLYASGNYEDSTKAFGSYGVAHTQRDSEWPRRAHDLMEYYNGGGPNAPTDPAHKYPWVGDEPPKRQDVANPTPGDWKAYFGTCAILGAGGTFHSETGKFGLPPTAQEAPLAAAALEGLNAFAAGVPLGGYTRLNDSSLRTYMVGNAMVRIRPTTATPPASGFTSLEGEHILWRK